MRYALCQFEANTPSFLKLIYVFKGVPFFFQNNEVVVDRNATTQPRPLFLFFFVKTKCRRVSAFPRADASAVIVFSILMFP
jgi:hypothetical protein